MCIMGRLFLIHTFYKCFCTMCGLNIKIITYCLDIQLLHCLNHFHLSFGHKFKAQITYSLNVETDQLSKHMQKFAIQRLAVKITNLSLHVIQQMVYLLMQTCMMVAIYRVDCKFYACRFILNK